MNTPLCCYSGVPLRDVVCFTPTTRDCRAAKGRYCFIDVNCALAHLESRVRKGDIQASFRDNIIRWMSAALGLDVRTLDTPPAPRPGVTYDEYVSRYHSFVPATALVERGVCAESLSSYVARFAPQGQVVPVTGVATVTHPVMSFSYSRDLPSPWTPPPIQDSTIRVDWRKATAQLHGSVHPTQFMVARLDSSGVTLYPHTACPPDLVSEGARYGRLSVGVMHNETRSISGGGSSCVTTTASSASRTQ